MRDDVKAMFVCVGTVSGEAGRRCRDGVRGALGAGGGGRKMSREVLLRLLFGSGSEEDCVVAQ